VLSNNGLPALCTGMGKRKFAFVSVPVGSPLQSGAVTVGLVPRSRVSSAVALPVRHRPRSGWLGEHVKQVIRSSHRARWMSFIGGGGILGVGPSEMAVIMAVGWFVLGPTKLFSLSREVGTVLGNLRRSADEARSTFTDAMEMEVAAEQAKKLEAECGKEGADVDGKEDTEGEAASPVDTYSGDAVNSEQSKVNADDDEEVPDSLREVALASARGPAPLGDLDVPARTMGPSKFSENGFGGLEARDEESSSEDIFSRKRFLDQLQRSSDPAQIPDLDLDADDVEAAEEDVEVARLEYELAKARLAAKRKREQALARNGTSDDAVGKVGPSV
jgi:Sec-independent protein translocase protein TatA